MGSSRRIIILFSGYNQRAVIAFLRTAVINEVPVAIIARDFEDPILNSEYKDKVVVVRVNKALDIEEVLSFVQKSYNALNANESIIAPSTEALNRFLLENDQRLKEKNCIVPLLDKKLYEQVSNKYSFGLLCEDHGIRVPKEYTEKSQIVLPCVAKPRQYLSENNKTYSPQIIFLEGELNAFLQTHNQEDFYFQEFVEGESYYLLYYIHLDGTINKFSQKNIAQQPGGKSILAAESSSFHLSKASKKYEDMFRSEKIRGFIMIEVKQNTNDTYMIEANPRFWGPSQLFVDAGHNLFESFLMDYGFIDRSREEKRNDKKVAKYFWFGGLCAVLAEGKEVVMHEGDLNAFYKAIPQWLEHDVYLRDDTLSIFKQEI